MRFNPPSNDATTRRNIEALNKPAHTCHWPGCPRGVPPKMWGCAQHWFMLPAELRRRIWATYRPGQEVTKDPSPAYVAAALAVRRWIDEQAKPPA